MGGAGANRGAPWAATLVLGGLLSGCASRPEGESIERVTFALVSGSASSPADGSVSTPISCSPIGLSLAVTPLTPGDHAAQTTALYDLAVTNEDQGPCGSRILLFEPGARPAGFSLFVDPPARLGPPGETQHFMVSLTGSTDAAPGRYDMPFMVFDATSGASVSGQLEYVLAAPEGCFVKPSRELFVTDLSIVEDPIRTSFDGPAGDPRTGAWAFGHLIEQAAPTDARGPAFVEDLFGSWLVDQTVNDFTVAARPNIESFLLREWPRRSDGHIDLARAPLRLLAIVNRIDLRSLASGHAGQGRFVFGVLDAAGLANPFTLILEYRIPASSKEDVLAWARAWHELGELPFPSEAFNARLQAITDRFTSRGAEPHGVNGSALSTVRTDEIALAAPWELRQFSLSRTDGLLHLAPVDVTPDIGYLGSPILADFVSRNERAILAGTFVVPLRFEGQPFRGGSAPNLLEPWTAPGIQSPEARRAFSLGTCSGCHSIPETGTEFVHVRPRDVGNTAVLSAFLSGAAVSDPVDGEFRTFNDLQRRKADLERLACRCSREPCSDAWEGSHRAH
jgi:hypothetical protein